MKPYLVKTPRFLNWIYPKRIWNIPNNANSVYLTFDDGPIPNVTTWVLDTLKKYNAKATFFCVGDNVRKNPAIFNDIKKDGHAIGNHTFNHLNGWKTENTKYIKNISLAEKELNQNQLLFRPPFGKITNKQAKILQKKGYTIIMWDVLSADYDTSISKETCLKNFLNTIKSGSIIVLHDSIKAENNLRYVLPKVLDYIKENGLVCKEINLEVLVKN